MKTREIEETAGIIYLMMQDQETHDSFGTFAAWMRDECPGVTDNAVQGTWMLVLRDHGALTPFQELFMWRRYGEIRETTDQRKGQALFNAVNEYNTSAAYALTGTLSDPFHNDDAIPGFLIALGLREREL